MARVLVLGAEGILGSSLIPALSAANHEPLRQSRSAIKADLCFDPGDFIASEAALRRTCPDVVINCVAATNVDQCEADAAFAYSGNVAPATVLAAVAARLAAPPLLIQISTDHVYDGPGIKTESDAWPINRYALSKLASEGPVLAAGGIVLRTNFIGRSRAAGRVALTDWLFRNLSDETAISVFDDVMISALHIDVLCAMIIRVIACPCPGLYNLGSIGGMSKADMAFAFAARLGLATEAVTRVPFAQSGLAARPLDMRMDPSRFATAFRADLPDFQSQVALAAGDYRE